MTIDGREQMEEWAVEHRQASLSEHEQGVLRIFRRVMGPALGAVLERALGLDHPAAQRQRAACPECGTRRRPHQWRKRQPVSVCGDTPFQRPYYWCAVCECGWVPADEVLGLEPPPDPETLDLLAHHLDQNAIKRLADRIARTGVDVSDAGGMAEAGPGAGGGAGRSSAAV